VPGTAEGVRSFKRVALDYDDSIAPAKGVSRGGRIMLLPNQPAAEEFSTLAHELAHKRLHRSRRAETTKMIRETEAEAVAFVVCHAIGLYTNTATADYIKVYDGDRATLGFTSVH
jgi:Zn-dependent peptidase ImmA (M78 family)